MEFSENIFSSSDELRSHIEYTIVATVCVCV